MTTNSPAGNGPVDLVVMQQRVGAAEEAAKRKAEELTAAKEMVRRLEEEHRDAVAAVRKAREDADALLPQCRMVSKAWRDSKEQDIGRVVILRKTPGGMLGGETKAAPPENLTAISNASNLRNIALVTPAR